MVLSAQGEAIEGQYKNTVTASAENPLGGSDLSAADDSYYFGALPGLTVDKLVSTTQEGPWSEAVTINPAETVFWQLSVTNTGNTVLTDVRFDDPALGAIEPVATLAPGQTVSRVIAQSNVTESYVNVVVASATVPGGGEVTGSDSSEVIVKPVVDVPPAASATVPPAAASTPPPAATTGDLPDTGATGVMIGLWGAAGLLVAGGLALVASRRRRSA